MEDERMNDDTDPAPVAAGERASRWLLWLFLAALALGLVLAALWWRTPREDPLATMVSAFQKQNSLTVFQAQVATACPSALRTYVDGQRRVSEASAGLTSAR